LPVGEIWQELCLALFTLFVVKTVKSNLSNTGTITTAKSNPVQTVQPYLFFDGRCEEAIEFYRTALGAEVMMLTRYQDSPEPNSCAPGTENKVMHASLQIGDTTLMASDGRCQGKPAFEGFSLSLTVPDETEAERLFATLADGGQVQMPLTKTFFSPRFGMVADRFGVSWMILVASRPS
jgi:PhnB protein